MGGHALPRTVHQNNPNDRIGQDILVPNNCWSSGANEGHAAWVLPPNDEYRISNWGSVGACTYDAGDTAGLGGTGWVDGGVIGKPVYVARIGYNASNAECCRTRSATQTVGGVEYTCDPNLLLNPQLCEQYLTGPGGNCSGIGLFNDATCVSWCAGDPAECRIRKSEYCNNPANVGTANCLNWCEQNAGKCDMGMNSFCTNNPDHELCTCINTTSPGYAHCYDQECINTGYLTSGMGTCPPQTNCSAVLDLQAGGSILVGDVEVECGVQNGGSGGSGGFINKVNNAWGGFTEKLPGGLKKLGKLPGIAGFGLMFLFLLIIMAIIIAMIIFIPKQVKLNKSKPSNQK